MIEEVSKTIKATLYDRITSPLFGAFVLSWCGWNWRLLVLFLTDSSITVLRKFEYLDTELYPSREVILARGLLLPVITTIFFIYVYPWFARKVYGYSREQQNKLKKIQLEKDGEKALTKEEAQEITNQALLSELQHQDEREKREARIRDLENLIRTLRSESVKDPDANSQFSVSETAVKHIPPENVRVKSDLKKKPETDQTYSPEVAAGMFALLEQLDKMASDKLIGRDRFIDAVSNNENLEKLPKTLLLHCLDKLIEGYFISEAGDSIYVKPKGREALVNRRLA